MTNCKLNTVEFYPDFNAGASTSYDREGWALVNLL